MNLALVEKLALGACQLCGTVFEMGDDPKRNRFSKLTRGNLRKAVQSERGLMFWNHELADRKSKLGIRRATDGGTFERRFICPDCVGSVLSQVVPDADS
jgi:hypothetical protein